MNVIPFPRRLTPPPVEESGAAGGYPLPASLAVPGNLIEIPNASLCKVVCVDPLREEIFAVLQPSNEAQQVEAAIRMILEGADYDPNI